MSEAKQTSVEWLENELKKRYTSVNFDKLFNQAKAMEKEQMNHIVDTNEMVNDMQTIADEQIKQNVQKLIDKDIFDQAILAMEEMYGSGCDTEIDAYFRGAKWAMSIIRDKNAH